MMGHQLITRVCDSNASPNFGMSMFARVESIFFPIQTDEMMTFECLFPFF